MALMLFASHHKFDIFQFGLHLVLVWEVPLNVVAQIAMKVSKRLPSIAVFVLSQICSFSSGPQTSSWITLI